MRDTHASSSPIVNIVGEKVALGPLSRDLIPLLTRWSNDLTARRNIDTPLPQTLEQRIARYERDAMGEDGVDFAVHERATWRPIGTTTLFHIDHRNGRARFGLLIGEPDARGKGYGTEATRLTLDYAFTALGLRNVGLTVAEWNIAGRRALRTRWVQGVRAPTFLPVDGRQMVGRRTYGCYRGRVCQSDLGCALTAGYAALNRVRSRAARSSATGPTRSAIELAHRA